MTMSSRDAILSRIRTRLAQEQPPERPPVPEVWPRENPPVEQMITRFIQELEAVSGEAVRCAGIEEARAKLAELYREQGWTKLGAMDRPACREMAAGLPPEQVAWAAGDWTAQGMADLSAGLIDADTLLADTGTAMIACAEAHDRLLCYLPPVCVVVARTEQLVEHLSAAWDDIAPRVADPQLRGEFVFITGPSRTADIEKILILGVHGPKRVIVLLID
jgi:L-lactate dehydrogenase complex protein LldG